MSVMAVTITKQHKININVDFLSKYFGRINFYVYFCGR